jgi:hypothetical protein
MSSVGIGLYLKTQVPGVWLRERNELGGNSPVPEDPGVPDVWLREGKMSLVGIALYLKTLGFQVSSSGKGK